MKNNNMENSYFELFLNNNELINNKLMQIYKWLLSKDSFSSTDLFQKENSFKSTILDALELCFQIDYQLDHFILKHNIPEIPERDLTRKALLPTKTNNDNGTSNQKLVLTKCGNCSEEEVVLLHSEKTKIEWPYNEIEKKDKLIKTQVTSICYQELKELDLEVNMKCVFSFVISPSIFYVQLHNYQAQLTRLTNELNAEMPKVKLTKCKSKTELKKFIHKYCIVFVPHKISWYRCEILDWMDNDEEQVSVYFVDFGNKGEYSYKKLQPMNTKYLTIPKIAIKCHLASIVPKNSNNWPNDAIKAFVGLSGVQEKEKPVFSLIYANKEDNSYGIHLNKENDDNEKDTLGQKLIDMGYAEFDMPDIDDNISELEEHENLEELVSGYKAMDEIRICRFTKSDGTCFKGKNCHLEHIQKGSFTTNKTYVFCDALNMICPPPLGITTLIRITSFISPCRFYAQLLTMNDNFESLMKTINTDISVQKLESFKLLPAIGEVVLVYDDIWMRGKVVDVSSDNVEIFAVDFGYNLSAKLKNIRKILEEFLHLPFQAVECGLHGYEIDSKANLDEARTYFQTKIFSKVFKAINLSKIFPLLLEVSDLNGVDLGMLLKTNGFVKEVQKTLFTKECILPVE